jgi:uncharacterized membrane protein YdfJ with MMPL/SSD domain
VRTAVSPLAENDRPEPPIGILRFLVRTSLTVIRWSAWVGWQAVRLAALAVLIFLEPFISVALAGLGASLVLTVLVFQVLAHRPGFPWLALLLSAVACALLRMAYLFLIELLQRR